MEIEVPPSGTAKAVKTVLIPVWCVVYTGNEKGGHTATDQHLMLCAVVPQHGHRVIRGNKTYTVFTEEAVGSQWIPEHIAGVDGHSEVVMPLIRLVPNEPAKA